MSEIGPPNSLAAFPTAASSSSKSHIKLGRVYGSEDAQAVVAVQGGAVWIYDVTSQQPITSFTVAPSTVFHSCPLSYHPAVQDAGDASSIIRRGKQRQRYTAVAVGKGENIAKSDEKKVVWVWKGEEVFEQSTLKLTHEVDMLLRVPEKNSMLAITSNQLTVISAQLRTSTISIASPAKSRLVTAGFLPKSSQDTIVVLVYDCGKAVYVGLKGVDEESCEEDEVRRPSKGLSNSILGKGERVSNAWVDEKTLVVHFLTSNGRMLPNALSLQNEPITSTKSFSFITTDPQIAALPDTAGPLFAHATSTSLVVFQPTYPAVLAMREFSIKNLTVKQVFALSSTLIAVVSSIVSDGAERWTIHTVDVAVPADGVGIASLLDSASRTQQFLVTSDAEMNGIGGNDNSNILKEDRAFLQTLKSTLASGSNHDSSSASAAWKTWNDEQEKPFATKVNKKARSRGVLAEEIIKLVFESALPTQKKVADVDTAVVTGPRGPYPREIVGHIVENGWANDGMIDGGLVMSLLAVGDWVNIDLAIRHIPSIPSSTLVSLLYHVLHPSESSLTATPTLSAFLQTYLEAPISPAMHKQALKDGLRQVEDVQKVLIQLASWLEKAGKNLNDLVWQESVEEKKQSVPVQELVLHTQLILDSHLPLLLSHPPSHALIQSLKNSLQPLLAAQSELTVARGLVESFVRLVPKPKEEKVNKKGKKGGKPLGGVGERKGEWLDPLYSVDEVTL